MAKFSENEQLDAQIKEGLSKLGENLANTVFLKFEGFSSSDAERPEISKPVNACLQEGCAKIVAHNRKLRGAHLTKARAEAFSVATLAYRSRLRVLLTNPIAGAA